MKCIIFRHSSAGEFFHAPGQQDPDPGLDAEGRVLAAAMAKHLKESGEEPTVVYTSTLARARQTGQLISKEFGLGKVIQEDGLGPTDHRGPTMIAVLKKYAAADPKLRRLVLVGHHDQIRDSLSALNMSDKLEFMPFAKSEYRIYDFDRDDCTWEELDRCLPSEVSEDFPDLY